MMRRLRSVRLEVHVEKIAREWNRADGRVDRNVADHPGDLPTRKPEPAGFPDDVTGKHRRYGVADAGHKADHRVETDATVEPRNEERVVEQLRYSGDARDGVCPIAAQILIVSNVAPYAAVISVSRGPRFGDPLSGLCVLRASTRKIVGSPAQPGALFRPGMSPYP